MSALSLIRDYGDISSEDSDSECEKIVQKRPRLPPPVLDKVATFQTEQHQDNPALHGGRIRSFPHVRGNWATFVYINFLGEDLITRLINKLKSVVLTVDDSCQICDNIHLSLSRTVVLHYHLISTFIASLQKELCNIDSFDVQFDSVEVYCNDEKTRTFIALKTDYCSEKFLLNIIKKVDKVLEEFKLPPFYKEPSFHTSILWVNGDKKTTFLGIHDDLNSILSNELKKNLRPLLINTIHCKVGHKQFHFSLI